MKKEMINAAVAVATVMTAGAANNTVKIHAEDTEDTTSNVTVLSNDVQTSADAAVAVNDASEGEHSYQDAVKEANANQDALDDAEATANVAVKSADSANDAAAKQFEDAKKSAQEESESANNVANNAKAEKDAAAANAASQQTLSGNADEEAESAKNIADNLEDVNENDIANANKSMNDASGAVEQAASDVDASQTAFENAKNEAETLNNKVNDAESNAASGEAEVTASEGKAASAEKIEFEAKDSYDSVVANASGSNPDYSKKQEAVENATAELDDAEAEKSSAEKAHDAAESDVKNKQNEADRASESLNAANNALAAKKNEITAKQAELAQAKENADKANANANDSKTTVDNLNEELSKLNEEKEKLLADKDKAQTAKDDAEAKLNEAAAREDELNKFINEANSAIGYYRSLGTKSGDLAVEVIQYATEHYSDNGGVAEGITEAGTENDATNLDSMLKALDYIDEANKLRASEGLDTMYVEPSAMASAQVAANMNSAIYNKTGKTGHWEPTGQYSGLSMPIIGTSHNAAWNYDGSDPYIQWYDYEKFMYEHQDLSDADFATAFKEEFGIEPYFRETGHYGTLTDPTRRMTGFAIAKKGGNCFAYDESFGSARNINAYKKDYTLMTTDEMRQSVKNYQASLSNGTNADYNNAVNELAEKKAQIEQLKNTSTTSIAEIAKATSELANIETRIAEMNQKIVDAQGNADRLAAAAQQAMQTVNARQSELDGMNTTAEEAAVSKAAIVKQTADANLKNAKDALSEATANAENANKRVAAAQQTVNDAQSELDSLDKAVTDARVNYEQAKKAADEARQNLAQARANLETNKATLADLQVKLGQAEADKTAAKVNLDASNEKLAEAKKDYASKKDNYDSLVAKHNKAEALRKTAAEKANTAAAEQAKLDELNKAVEEKTEAYNKAVEAAEKAKNKLARANLLKYQGIDTAPVTDADFAYLNDYVEAYKNALSAVDDAQKDVAEAKKAYDDSAAKIAEGSDLCQLHAKYLEAVDKYNQLVKAEKDASTITYDASNADGSMSFKTGADANTLEKVLVDDNEISVENYSVSEKDNTITLSKDYLDTLKSGNHTITIVSVHGSAELPFVINAKPDDNQQPETINVVDNHINANKPINTQKLENKANADNDYATSQAYTSNDEVHTGDDFTALPYTISFMVSAIAVGSVVVLRRRRKTA